MAESEEKGLFRVEKLVEVTEAAESDRAEVAAASRRCLNIPA